ncbi:MAG TPA: hypothetical protein VJT32_10075, partial [bacterium]|nr:hypothetical protein [bacterium]
MKMTMRVQQRAWLPTVAVALGAVLLGSGAHGGAAAGRTGRPGAAEVSPAGDIPDTQVFVTFMSGAGGYKLSVPEGWARTTSGPDVR